MPFLKPRNSLHGFCGEARLGTAGLFRRPRGAARRVGSPWLVVAAAAGILCAWALPCGAQERVADVVVSGNVLTDSVLVSRTFGVEPGDRITPNSIADGIRALFALGFFSDVEVRGRPGPDGWTIIIAVEEWPKVSEIKYRGEDKIKEGDLKDDTLLSLGSIIKSSEVEAERKRILGLYSKKGYPAAKVKPVYEQATKASEKVLVFEIDEGEKVKVVGVSFDGNQAFSDDELRDKVKSKPRSWPRKSYFKSEQLELDAEELTAFYRKNGYKNMEVTDTKVSYGADGSEVTVTFVVDEGGYYSIGEVALEGNQEVDSSRLMRVIELERGDEYNEEDLNKSLIGLQEIYSDVGYVYATVDPVWTERGDTLDLTFNVNEGIQSHVKEVKIAGNTRTKEKVIRRELTVKPGDVFSRSSFLRSQREIMALGFFEDVQLSFQPAGPEGDLDVTFDVKEKQVGTAMAGAGYSSDIGLTGFVELGHNNLFGRGQSVMLRLERGTRRNNVEISFTEPWLRDTPTLLGIDLFNMTRRRDIFDEKRTGGAIRLGRRLTWPDYTRVGFSYRLENVTVDNFQGLSPEQEAFFLAEGDKRLTSSVLFSILRNSTDNPFYPTSGSNTVLETEIAGGPFAGDIDFRKHILDHRTFFSTFWKFVVMLRSRVGVLSSLTGKSPPSYETFRLGGTGRRDYLRGYPDYEIVPEENITVASDGSVTRYPGGRFALTLTAEYQFPIVHPVHGLFFFDAGDTWTSLSDDFDLGALNKGAGFGVRIEIPGMGMVGFDYGYGFDREGGGKWEPHLQLGRSF
jgi:outer membrane protein insertion porin family